MPPAALPYAASPGHSPRSTKPSPTSKAAAAPQSPSKPTSRTTIPSSTRFDTASREFGGIDIVVINAGGNLDDSHDIESGSPEQWTKTVQVNLIGSYHTARAAIPHLKERGAGKIIAIGSGLGHRGRPGESAYASAKAGLSMLVRVLAQELWQHNISVNELIPGPVLTERVARTHAHRPGSVFQDDSEWIKTPDDVVPLALFLATQPDKGPTGQTYSLMRRDP